MTEIVAASGGRASGDLLVTPEAGTGSPTGSTAGSTAGSTVSIAVRARRAVLARLLRRPAGVPWWFEFVLLYGLYRFYSAIRNGVGQVHEQAYANAAAILGFEDRWGLSWERGLNGLARRSDVLRDVFALDYASFHLYLTPVVLIWLYRRRRAYYRLASTVWMATTFLALVGFYLWPTAPPRLLPSEGFVDVMRMTSSWGWWPTSGSPASNAISNQFAAMPSLHCAWAAWCGIVVFLLVRRPWVRVLALLYPLATFTAVMATGNHYLLDGVAGVGLLALVGGVLLPGAWLVRSRRTPVAPG